MMEGESGSSGCIKYPQIKKVSKLCKKYNILLIVDEVMSGFVEQEMVWIQSS